MPLRSAVHDHRDLPRTPDIWHWYRLGASVVGALFLILGGAACVINFFSPRALDFVSFWAAGRLVLDGHPALAYDLEAHRSVERLAAPITGLLPFPYPPSFLLLVTPFALAPYPIAFALWVISTSLLYAWGAARLDCVRQALANPSAVSNFLTGQNGFLVAALFTLGMAALPSSPFVAGVVLGMMAIKPQLAALLPVALIAGREWRATTGAILSATGLAIFAFLLFGLDVQVSFLKLLPAYVGFMSAAKWPWSELASPFAVVSFFGIQSGIAAAVQLLTAVTAAVMTARAWWRKDDNRIPTLAAGSLLVSPYVLTYDALLLFVPIGWLISRRRRAGAVAAIWLLAVLPVAGHFGVYRGPNTIPFAALLCLWALDQRTDPAFTSFVARLRRSSVRTAGRQGASSSRTI